MWESFQDLLEQGAKLAAAGLQGIFGLDILSADIQDGTRNFRLENFSALLINHGRQLKCGEQKAVRYGQIFAMLQKRVSADWGKIDVTYHVEILERQKAPLDKFIKKMKRTGKGEENALYLIHDLGVHSVWDLAKAEYPDSVHIYQSERN